MKPHTDTEVEVSESPETHYVQPIVPLVMGLDPSQMRLGVAFTELLSGKPRWCVTIPIYERDKGWREHQMRRALQSVQATLLAKTEAHFPVVHIAVEKMFVGVNSKTSLELAYISGEAAGICTSMWPDTQIDQFSPAEWRKANDLPGNATKGAVYQHVVELGYAPPPRCKHCDKSTVCLDTCGQDAADASLISRAGQRAALRKPPTPAMAVIEGAPV